jgi:membrane protein implicated in regulation of membrane protease activity
VGGFILGLFGARKAPLPLVLEAGLLGWGVFGFCANMFFQVGASPSALLAMPAIAVAAVGGFATMHIAGATFARFMPEDESSALSRNSLFGIAGEVVYPVSETGGRIHVYDPYGTMHDESCRVAAGQQTIERGRRAMVVDIDAKGTLIVEEAP